MIEEDEDMSLEGLELEVEPAELKPVPRGKVAKPNPMAGHLKRSWDEKRSLSVKVPAAHALAVGRSLRKAGMRRFSVHVQYHVIPYEGCSPEEETYCPEVKVRDLDPTQRVRVAFQANEITPAARRVDDAGN